MSAVTVHCSQALLHSRDPLPGALLPELLQARGIELRHIQDSNTLPEKTPWAYLECNFDYSTHKTQTLVTRFPTIFVFVGPEDFHAADSPLLKSQEFARRLSESSQPFSGSRIIFVVCKGTKRTRPDVMESLVKCLLRCSINCVETFSAHAAAEYVLQCTSAVLESRKRKFPSRFKTEGERCQTVPKTQENQRLITWVSMLMQVPSVSEEIAKVIAKRHSSPAAMLAAVNGTPPAKSGFLEDLEYPIRGQKSTRRVGPVISRRLHSLFSANIQESDVLV